MNFIPKSDFIDWITSQSIGRHPKYVDSPHLQFLPLRDDSRFWEYPKNPEDFQRFLSIFLNSLPLKSGAYLYPPEGFWREKHPVITWYDNEMGKLLESFNVFVDKPSALFFSQEEIQKAIELTDLLRTYPSLPDLIIIPCESNYIFYFDHHKVLHVEFRNKTIMDDFIMKIEKQGIYLPTELPDVTFKPQKWMDDADTKNA